MAHREQPRNSSMASSKPEWCFDKIVINNCTTVDMYMICLIR